MTYRKKNFVLGLLALAMSHSTILPSASAQGNHEVYQESAAARSEPAIPLERAAAIQRWRDTKFGMFIHWGLYSIPAGMWDGKPAGKPGRGNYAEHIQMRLKIPGEEYSKLVNEFNPVKFNADEWVRLAKETGMRHIVITAKHQDGFAMYDSEVSDFNVVDATPFGRDPMKELAAAAKDQGLGFGFYYSQARDHHHPLANWNKHGNTWDFPKKSKEDFITYLNEKAKPQIKELLTGYGDLWVMWFDVPYNIPTEACQEILEIVRKHQPTTVVNSRLGGEGWDYRTLGDNEISDKMLDEPWETCMTTNDSWGYNQLDHNWKSPEQLIRHLVDIVSKGGCLLLNVGPTAEGVIPEKSVKRLKAVGKWMQVNGESIYDTEASPVGIPDWGRVTRKAKGDQTILYLHVFDWPENGQIRLPLTNNVASCSVLSDSKRAAAAISNGKAIVVHLTGKAPDPVCSVLKITIDGKPATVTRSAPATGSPSSGDRSFDRSQP